MKRGWTLAVVVLLCVGCGKGGDDRAVNSGVKGVGPDSPQGATVVERELAANAYGLVQTLTWSTTGDLIPARTADGQVFVGDQTIELSRPDASFKVFEVGYQMCVEVRAEVDGTPVVSSYTGLWGRDGESAPGQSCLEAHTNAVEVEVPTKNYPGLIGWDEILPDSGTCVDLILFSFGEDEAFEVPRTVDCSGPHEFMVIAASPLDLPGSPSDEEIDAAGDESCVEGIRVWIRSGGPEPLSYTFWTPYAWAYQQGGREVKCLAQYAEDVEQVVTWDEAYG